MRGCIDKLYELERHCCLWNWITVGNEGVALNIICWQFFLCILDKVLFNPFCFSVQGRSPMSVQFLVVINVLRSIPVYTNIMLYILIPNHITVITVGKHTSRFLHLLCTSGQHTMTQSPLKKNKRLFLSHLQVRVSVFESFVVKRKKNGLDNILLVFYTKEIKAQIKIWST